MRSRWLMVIVVASLCLNVAVVGTYFFRRARRDRSDRLHVLTAEARERMRKVREAAMPEFSSIVGRIESTDSLLWAEMRRESPDSARVESLCQELGQIHGRMRAMVCRQIHRELQLMPAEARAEYLEHVMMMRPGFGGPGRVMGRRMRHGSRMQTPNQGEPLPDEPPPGPPPESGD